MKKIIIALLAIVLIIPLGLYFYSNRLDDKSTEVQPSEKFGYYTIEDKELGYSFKLSDEYFSQYRAEKQGYNLAIYIPTNDPNYNNQGDKFAVVMSLTAVPIAEAEKDREKCQDYEVRDTIECTTFNSQVGKNDLYYFIALPSGDPPRDFMDSKVIEVGMNSLRNLTTIGVSTPPQFLKYENLSKGYSISYPIVLNQHFSGFSNSLYPPLTLEKNYHDQPLLTRTLPIEYCDLSGECKDTTLNFAISASMLDMTKQQLLSNDSAETFEKSTINNLETYTYRAGAEGEGIIWHFQIVDSTHVYALGLRYLDEDINLIYKNQPDFIPYQEQRNIFTNILNTTDFFQPLNQ